jgi:hypothetical protein
MIKLKNGIWFNPHLVTAIATENKRTNICFALDHYVTCEETPDEVALMIISFKNNQIK